MHSLAAKLIWVGLSYSSLVDTGLAVWFPPAGLILQLSSPASTASSFLLSPMEASRQCPQELWEGFMAHKPHCSGRKQGAHWLQLRQIANRISHETINCNPKTFFCNTWSSKGSLLGVTLILKLGLFWLIWSASINSGQAICFCFWDFYLCVCLCAVFREVWTSLVAVPRTRMYVAPTCDGHTVLHHLSASLCSHTTFPQAL